MTASNGAPPVVYSRRVGRIRSFEVMDVLARAAELEQLGRDVVHLEVGEPDFLTAEPIRAAGREAINAGHTRYTQACGLPELRTAIARHYQITGGVEIDPARVMVTSGATGALGLLGALLLDPGDRVLLMDPGYPCYANFVHVADARPSLLPLDPELGLTSERFREGLTADTRLAVVGSPSNPTGDVLSAQVLGECIDAASEVGTAYLSDETYQGLTWGDNPAASAITVRDGEHTFVVNSFSKFFGMTGWRVGWLIAPTRAIGPLTRLAQNTVISPPSIGQYAALAAFSPEAMAEHERRRDLYQQRCEFLVMGLRQLGFDVARPPSGAFYVYAGIRGLGLDDARLFCSQLLEQEGVAVTPGTDFGEHAANAHVRFAATCDLERLEDALSRIRNFLERRVTAAQGAG